MEGAAVPVASTGDELLHNIYLHALWDWGGRGRGGVSVCIPSVSERCPLLSPSHSTPGNVKAGPLLWVPRGGGQPVSHCPNLPRIATGSSSAHTADVHVSGNHWEAWNSRGTQKTSLEPHSHFPSPTIQSAKWKGRQRELEALQERRDRETLRSLAFWSLNIGPWDPESGSYLLLLGPLVPLITVIIVPTNHQPPCQAP